MKCVKNRLFQKDERKWRKKKGKFSQITTSYISINYSITTQ